ncbi:STAS domain-containing protein [Sporomusa malonica]|uniref:Anti-sigma factor antagonist n=1 Tax=Sporomusa malonica TaxID=112901 RepID=A0A1W2E6G7_9FIRM|nr:STAS domain-containing protein [Sporomusa malonica]SMD05389.1 anti-sigma B factor antagonist [Sporomusa malonica]
MEFKTVLDVKIIMIIPRVDASNAKTVEAQLAELVNGGTKNIVCNFSQNEYISSAGLRVFLSTLKIVKKSGGQIVLCGLQPYVQEVFDMAGFSQLFKICNSEEQAIQAF